MPVTTTLDVQSVTRPVRPFGRFFAMALDTFLALLRPPFQWRECAEVMWFIVRVSIVPTIFVANGFTILVIFQLNLVLRDLGAVDLAGAASGIVAVQQIGPFATALVIAGAGGTAICAELGARTVREEIDAIRVLGIDPIHRLVVPRVVAAVVIALFLNFIVATEGVLGGYLFSVFVQGADPGAYASSLTLVTGVPELIISVVKSVAFGLIAGLVACYLGLNVKGGPKGVGEAVNQSVVYSVATLEFVNLLLTTFQFKILS